MRVLLVNSNMKDDLLAAPPLGLCYVAEAAESAGHRVRVLDLCFARHSLRRQLRKAIGSFGPHVIGISVRNIDNVNMLHPVSYLPEAEHITRLIREITDVPLVVGGSGASLLPAEILRLLKADYVVVSDAEESFPKLLNALEDGASSTDIPGVGLIQSGGRFRLTPPRFVAFRAGTPDLGKWLDMKAYQRIGSSYNLQTKRGCRQSCIYCTYNQSLEGNKRRLRPPAEVVDEIEAALFRYRPHTFEFVDSVFNDPLEHSVEILEEIIRRPWKGHFTAMGVMPRQLDESYLDLMWRAGFRSFMITPESASEIMIRNYRKGFTREDVFRSAEAINKTSFAAWWYFMLGGPGETNETLKESLAFAVKYLPKRGRPVTNVAHFFVGVRVYPGTRLWDIALEEGVLSPGADPLQPLWYLSKELDLEHAVDQMTQAAAICPEIYLGFDERVLVFSKAAALLFKFLGFQRPYWRHFPAVNQFGLKTGIRFMYRPPDIPGMLRNALTHQSRISIPCQRGG